MTTYAPVAIVELSVSADCLVGIAAPAGGVRPCMLELFADDRPISSATATRYDATAARRGLRLGWCGVEVPGLSTAAALGRHVVARCQSSGKIVWRHTARRPFPARRGARDPLSLFDLVRLRQSVDCAPDLDSILPFVEGHLDRHGVADFVAASYQTILGRPAELPVIEAVATLSRSEARALFPQTVLASREFRDRPFAVLPGPFSHGFGYDLRPLLDG